MDLQEPFPTIFKTLKFFGFWGENSIRHKRLAVISFIVLCLLPGLLNILSVEEAYDGNDVISILVYSPTYTICYCFGLFLIMAVSRVQKFLNLLNRTISDDPMAKEFIDDSYKKSKAFYTLMMTLIFFINVSTSIMTFITGKPLISMALPEFLTEVQGLYYIVWLFQSVCFLYMSVLLANLEELFFIQLVMIYGYSRYCKKVFHELDVKLRVEVFIKLRRLVNEYNEKYAIVVTYNGFVSTYVLCCIVYLLVQHLKDLDTKNVLHLIIYALSVTFQLFKPCFIGQLIESGTDELSRMTYSGDWIDKERSYKKSMLIVIENVKNPLKLKMFGVFHFNFESFLAVLKTVYSTYSILVKVKSKYD